MGNEKAEHDVLFLVTCTYCGTQTGLSFKHLDGDKPLKCRACGAPLEAVPPPKPPPKRPPKRRKKIRRDYGAFLAESHDYDRRLKEEENLAGFVGLIIIGALFFIIILLLQRC